MIEITERELKTILEDYLDSFEDDDDARFKLYRDYSGRAMYGKTCFGIVVDSITDAFEFYVAVAIVLDADDARELALAARTDSMGLGMIVYFPGVELVEN